MDKLAIVEAAGIGCGKPICACAMFFAESLSDEQAALLAHLAADKATEQLEKIELAQGDELTKGSGLIDKLRSFIDNGLVNAVRRRQDERRRNGTSG